LVVALEQLEELPGDDALQASPDLAGGPALGGPAGSVGAGQWVIAQAGLGDGVQGAVELPVPGPVRAGDGCAAQTKLGSD
jgi:hypothetical protein